MCFEILKCFLEQNPSLANLISYIHKDVFEKSTFEDIISHQGWGQFLLIFPTLDFEIE